MNKLSTKELFKVWGYVAANSFGGPAGQIAVIHKLVVEDKKLHPAPGLYPARVRARIGFRRGSNLTDRLLTEGDRPHSAQKKHIGK